MSETVVKLETSKGTFETTQKALQEIAALLDVPVEQLREEIEDEGPLYATGKYINYSARVEERSPDGDGRVYTRIVDVNVDAIDHDYLSGQNEKDGLDPANIRLWIDWVERVGGAQSSIAEFEDGELEAIALEVAQRDYANYEWENYPDSLERHVEVYHSLLDVEPVEDADGNNVYDVPGIGKMGISWDCGEASVFDAQGQKVAA